ncbi:MAG: tryptophan synthase subunit alpha [Ignavibacteriales bacterium]|nr:tryptophan synthase subunit alpha [Ignavibacteriales bacterium]
MSAIRYKIENINSKGEKALTVFLTSGFPNPQKFVKLVLEIEKAGADLIEIGLPFGDSLADGPVVQSSYVESLKNKINLTKTLEYISEIKSKSDIPIILMSSSNPILNYGKNKFCTESKNAKVDGLIIPDVPLEEYDDFFTRDFTQFDKILLTTPTSSEKRIKSIDEKSSGFLYCVSVVGTTGVRNNFDEYVLQNLNRTYKIASKNKMQIGFGISSGEDVKRFSPYCDGVIVGSAVIKSLLTDDEKFTNTIKLVKELKEACKN